MAEEGECPGIQNSSLTANFNENSDEEQEYWELRDQIGLGGYSHKKRTLEEAERIVLNTLHSSGLYRPSTHPLGFAQNTVGYGISPYQPFDSPSTSSGSLRAHGLSPPVGNYTPPLKDSPRIRAHKEAVKHHSLLPSPSK